jgi:hypothetical protein
VGLSLASIQAARDDDEQLFNLLSTALGELFPPDMQSDRDLFLVALTNAPRGLRAMAGIYDLDASMAVDDLAWHFGNHSDERFLHETVASLKELEAVEAAEIFLLAWDAVKAYLPEIRNTDWGAQNFNDYLERTGIQSRVKPLNERMWAICQKCGTRGLMQFCLAYARKYPERCLKP